MCCETCAKVYSSGVVQKGVSDMQRLSKVEAVRRVKMLGEQLRMEAKELKRLFGFEDVNGSGEGDGNDEREGGGGEEKEKEKGEEGEEVVVLENMKKK
jgi:hypothetical protein